MANRGRGGYDDGYGNGGGQRYVDDTTPRGGNPRSPRGHDSYGGHPNGGPGGYGSPGGQDGYGSQGGGGHGSAMSQHGGQQQQGRDSDCNVDELMTTLRAACSKRGVSGFKQFRRMFKIYDRGIDDKKLSSDELFYGLQNYGAEFTQKECKAIIRQYSRDGDDFLSFNEFMRAVRPAMSKSRVDLIRKAFSTMDKSGDGVIEWTEIKKKFKVEEHPKFKSGELTKQQCYELFLQSFEPEDSNKDGKVTWDEFLDYYCGVSSNIDRDVYFDYMMRQAWKF